MAAAEAYYEAQGRTWERAAYIKAPEPRSATHSASDASASIHPTHVPTPRQRCNAGQRQCAEPAYNASAESTLVMNADTGSSKLMQDFRSTRPYHWKRAVAVTVRG